MSFTTLSIVRKHLLSSDSVALEVKDIPVTLCGEEETLLPHQSIEAQSEHVKTDSALLPQSEGPIVLSGTDEVRLSSGYLIAESVVVTLSEAMFTVYKVNVDYKLDAAAGTLSRLAGSTIPDQQAVYVYYNKYLLSDPATDYLLDASRGAIRRRSGSAIPDGATVLMDYNISAGSLTDGMLTQAITEAQDLIVRSLSSDYTAGSTDQGLQTGATLLVLSIAARDLATEALSCRQASDAGGRAKEWQNLSNLYEARAWLTLDPFLDRYASRSPERHPNA